MLLFHHQTAFIKKGSAMKSKKLTIFSVSILALGFIALIVLIVYQSTGHTNIIKGVKEENTPAQHLTVTAATITTEADVRGIGNVTAADIDSYKQDTYHIHIVFNDNSTYDTEADSLADATNPQFRPGAVIERIVAQHKVTYTYNVYDRHDKPIHKNKILSVINPTDNIRANINTKSHGNYPKVNLGIESPIVYNQVSPGNQPIKLSVKTIHYAMVGTLKMRHQEKFYDQTLSFNV